MDPNYAPISKFRALVTGNCLDQFRQKNRQYRDYCILHGFSPSVRVFNGDVKACLAFCRSCEAGLALVLAAHYRVYFSVLDFSNYTRICPVYESTCPYSIFPHFLALIALYFAAQNLQISAHKVFLIEPMVKAYQ